MRLARVLGALGRILLTAGVLTLLFVVYQLWGTGIHEARAQGALSDEFTEALAEAGAEPGATGSEGDGAGSGRGTDGSTDEAGVPPPPPELADGDAVARIEIPTIGVDKIVVEGVSLADLKRGPGRFPTSPLPGQPGNAAIAGHRTTYGAPFHRLDELEPGDEILTTTVQGSFRYVVREQLIVEPNQVEVLDDHGDDRLTLVACHPKYSARQRIIIVADLDSDPLPGDQGRLGDADDQPAYTDLDAGAGLSGERATAWPTVFLGISCGLIWLAAWVAAKMVKPWIAYAAGLPFFMVALFYFYEEMSRLLPANF